MSSPGEKMRLLDEFLEQMNAQGYSSGTVLSTRFYLEKFLDYLQERGINNIQTVSPRTISQYNHHLVNIYRKASGEKLHSSSIHHSMNAIKKYFSFLVKRGHILFAPTGNITLPRQPRAIPKNIPTELEVEKLLNRPDTDSKSGLRDRAILELFYSTGIRRQELINLNLYDLDTQSGTLRVSKGKGGKDRTVPVGKEACYWVKCYLREFRSKWLKSREQALFLNASGQRVSSSLLNLILRTYGRERGEKRVTCHSLRHACATHMLRGGADIRMIQKLLGHKRLETTEIYTRVTPVDLKKTLKKYHPRERKKRDKKRPKKLIFS